MEKLRFMSIIAVLCGFIGAALMFIIGAAKTIKAFQIYFFQVPLTTNPPPPARLDFTDQAMLAIVGAVDAFLIALVLLIFAFGVYNLFIGKVRVPDHMADAPWASITTIGRLKQVLVEVVLVVLAVMFLSEALFQEEELSWRILVLPLGMALIALSLKLVDWRSH